jgi:recombination protein RecT
METEVTTAKKSPIVLFENTLDKYKSSIINLLGKKYGISPEEFMVKAINAVKKNAELLKCTPQSLFGSILYFAEVGLPFNTPEGFGYILPYKVKGNVEATPIIGYKGLIEIAYRNPKMKSIRIQAVYANDLFEYEYGTTDYIKHKPIVVGDRGDLIAVYAIAKLEGIDPLFQVVHKNELDAIQRLSKSGNSDYSPYNNGTDVFNVMQSKVALKLLFKTLPKTDNDSLIKALELDNKFDYEKNTRIRATEDGYETWEEEQRVSAMEQTDMPKIEVVKSEKFEELKATSGNVE